MNHRNGLTMLEVIFAMVVILVGLVSIAFLIPLAGREAEDSYQITQGLSAGESALAMFSTTNIAQPSTQSPWCLIDDVAPAEQSVFTMRAAYDAAARTFPVPPTAVQAAVAQNEAIGLGFCVDPMFWGFQSRTGNNLPAPFARTRFPYLADQGRPTDMTIDSQYPRAPRLLRCSLTDPQASVPGSWLRQPAAVRLATMYGGDVIQPSTTKNKAIGPMRSVYVGTDSSILTNPNSAQQSSWMVAITPSENTPIIPLERVAPNYTPTVLANQPVDVPNLFDVALVVFSKRDAREFLSIPAGQRFQDLAALPSSERIFKVSSISPEALTNGSFEITLNGYPTLDGKVQVGDWLMMSRFAMRDLLPRTTNTQIARQVHRWYRVVGVTDSTTLVNQPIQRKVRVSGKPWNWTEGEINDAMERFGSLPTKMQVPPDPADYEIQAVLLKNVVQVYERQMDLR